MNEHKKEYSTETNIFGDTAHIYTDGVHTGSSWGSQSLADEAYQKAKHDDLDHVDYTVSPSEFSSIISNSDGKKINR